ncbi:MAG: hypothetical protein CL666_08735 [Balneola sp.]|nr:hypothetical protein [Balneola sp.]|tara:strand:+ start:9768 stop:10232 length:465 start_codon:yes stop_codon:yes gene_type:complete
MKKVYQTIVDSEDGNCAQAAIASLFGKELEEVPNFVEYRERYTEKLLDYFEVQGYPNATVVGVKRHEPDLINKAIALDSGVGGFFYASIHSMTYEGGTHAVVVDSKLNVVHDPNPNQRALGLGRMQVVSMVFPNGIVIGKHGSVMKMEEVLDDI